MSSSGDLRANDDVSAGVGAIPHRQRFWGANAVYSFQIGVFGVYGIMTVALIVAGVVQKNGTAPLVTGLILAAIFLPMAPMLASFGIRPVVLDGHELRLPKYLGSNVVDLRRLAGVGLIYQSAPGTRQAVGWTIRLWTDEGKELPIRRWVVTGTESKAAGGTFVSLKKRDWSFPLPHEDWADLSHSKPGRIATAIFKSAVAWQGGSGPITQSLEKQVRYNPNADVHFWAWWSPDGTMGRAAGIQPLDPASAASAATPRQPSRARRLARAIAIAVGWSFVSFIAAFAVSLIDGASDVTTNVTATQHDILNLATAILIGGIVLSGAFAGWTFWRSRTKAHDDETLPIAHFGLAPAQSEPGAPVSDTASLPGADPEVVRAKRRTMLLSMLTGLLIGAWAIVIPLLLGHPAQLSDGETCSAVFAATAHRSIRCDAWKNHQLSLFIWIALALFVVTVVLVVVAARAISHERRVKRSLASVGAD